MRLQSSLSACALALSLCFGAACSSGPPKLDPEKELALLRETALQYYQMNDLERAEGQAVKGLDIEPDDIQLKLLIGWIRLRRGAREDLNVAERVFRDVDKSGDFRATLGLGETLERKGVLFRESAEKIESGERVTDAIDPKKRATELRESATKCWNESVECLQRTLAKKDGDPQALNALVRVYSCLGNYAKSLEWADKLIAQTEQELVIWTKQIARPDLTATEEKRMRDLKSATERLLVGAHELDATVLVALDRRADAIAHIDRAIDLAPETPELYSRRGQLLHDVGRCDEAIQSLEKFLRTSPLEFEHADIQHAYTLIDECKIRGATKTADAGGR